MKELDVEKTGKLGTVVRYKSPFGLVSRQYVVPRDPHTELQMSRRRDFSKARFLWGRLTDEQRFAWCFRAEGLHTRPRLNQSGPLSGYLLFVKINCNLAALGLPMVEDPPGFPRFGANPVGQLAITYIKGELALRLKVSRIPASDIIVLASRPRSAGRSFVDHFTILDVLPEPDRGWSDITELYRGKHPVLPPDSRIFIRTVQQIDGWRDQPKQTSALVPAP